MEKFVRLIKLPHTVRGMTVTDSDGNYNIYINCNLSHETQIMTYYHEVSHVENKDFESYAPVRLLEEKTKYFTGG